MELRMAATTTALGIVLLPSTSTAADGFSMFLGMGLFAVAAVFFILRRRTT
jgi:LPXTG-motif cell wall-anchored protein